MNTLKLFFKLILIGIAFYIFSDFCIYFANQLSYSNIKEYSNDVVSPKIEITEARRMYMGGYINGKITNDTNQEITQKYVKFDFFSRRNNSLGTKYIKLENLKPGETREFSLSYKIRATENFSITLVDEKVGETMDPEEEAKVRSFWSFILLVWGITLAYVW